MRLLAKSTPRVKVYSIGTSEEGREMIAVAVASEALMAKLDENKADLARLADPRTIKMDDELADRIARRAAPVYYITGTIHSTEAGAPTALMYGIPDNLPWSSTSRSARATSCCSPTTRSGAAARSAATSWCSTRC